jgi:hypothetical protein
MIDFEGKGVTLHRIYLQKNADGSVSKLDMASKVNQDEKLVAKKVFGPPRDMSKSFIDFDVDVKQDIIARGYVEGVETGIAVREATGLPVRVCYSNTVLENQTPGDEDIAVVFADKDRSFGGQKSAFNLAKRFRREGTDAMVLLPTLSITGKGVDWLDETRTFGHDHVINMFNYPATLEGAQKEHEAFLNGGAVNA